MRPADPLAPTPTTGTSSISEAAGAEKYSRRLSERITDGYAAKFDQQRRPGWPRRPRLPAPARAAAHPRDRPRHASRIAVGLFERYALGNVSADAARGGDRARRHPHPDDPHEPALQRLDPPPPAAATRARRPAPWRATPARLRRAVGAGRGGPASQDPGRGTEAPRPRRPAGRPPRVRLRATASGTTARSAMAATASSTSTHARPGAARPGSATRPGRGRCSPRSRASRSTTTRSRRSSRSSGRPGGRSRSTGPGSSGRSASSPWSTPPAASGDDAYLARLKALREAAGRARRAGRSRASRHSARSSGCSALGRVSPAGRRTEGEGRPDARHLRADHGRGPRDRRASGSPRRPTRTDWRWRCPKRLQWRARQDSNLRPSAPEADALSTELQARDGSGSCRGGANPRRRRPRRGPQRSASIGGHLTALARSVRAMPPIGRRSHCATDFWRTSSSCTGTRPRRDSVYGAPADPTRGPFSRGSTRASGPEVRVRQDGVADLVEELVVRGDEGPQRPDGRRECVELGDGQSVRFVGPNEVGEVAGAARRRSPGRPVRPSADEPPRRRR